MENKLIFNQYDMVVSFTEDTLNQELKKLVTGGTIKPTVVLSRTADNSGNYNYTVWDNESQVPAGAEYISGNITPAVRIDQSGSNIVLVLNFDAGKASFIDKNGFGPLAELKQYDMTGWKYGFNVNLDLSEFKPDGTKIPSPAVAEQLNNFSADNLSISCLFMDFVSTDLKSTIPAETSCPAEMTEFMSFYFEHLSASGNPYILGYNANANNNSTFSQNIPAELTPTGANYSMFADHVNTGTSNLNYAMVTKGGFVNIQGSSPTLDSNWFSANSNPDGKIIISHLRLLEALILVPFYNNLQQQVFQQVSQHVSVGPGQPYNAAKTVSGSNWSFNMSNVNGGDDQYVNTFTVGLQNAPDSIVLSMNGAINIYKEVSKDAFFCTARAHASANIQWAGTVTLNIRNGQLNLDKSFGITSKNSDHGTNTCADAFSWMGKILGGFLDLFTFWTDGGALSNLLDGAMSVDIPGIGDISIGLDNFSSVITGLIIMPTGSNYQLSASPASPTIDSDGNVYLDLSKTN
ncbi:hypothetical protein ACUN24_04000 [Pedobacter sp. WC2501]|uniref:hypothetical protein n=1 Tax=Pedobacter sp. WC2501 TaxID=3461400 RepID=UPI004045C813